MVFLLEYAQASLDYTKYDYVVSEVYMEGDKHKHLDFIQIVITRMAVNSFLIKGWVVTLTAAIFALSAKDANTKYILFAYFPIFIFWILDGYYLYQERLYRSLYNFVRKLNDDKIDFCLDATKYKDGKKNNWPMRMISAKRSPDGNW